MRPLVIRTEELSQAIFIRAGVHRTKVLSQGFQTFHRGAMSLGDPSKRDELVSRASEELTRNAETFFGRSMSALDHIVVDRPVTHCPLVVAHQVAENLRVNHND